MRLSRLFPALLTAGLSLAFFACQDPTTGTSDEHETSMARLYRTDGTPAARAKMKFYSVSDTAQVPAALTYTTENGEIQLPELPAGMYNAVASDGSGAAALLDSIVFSANGKASVLSDTLKPMSVLRGRVVVEPQHSPQIAWIQVMGMGVAANVDSLGRFEISLPAGRATIYALTREAHYTPTFKVVTAGAGDTQDLGDLRLIYTGIPVVTGLEVQYDSLSGVATVRWNRSLARGIMGYRVRLAGDRIESPTWVSRSSGDTVFADTIFWLEEKDPPVDFRIDWMPMIMAPRARTYSVVALDSSMDSGVTWGRVELQAKSPLLVARRKMTQSRLGDLPEKCNQLDTLAGGLVCIRSPEEWDFPLQDSVVYWFSQTVVDWAVHSKISGRAFDALAWRGMVWSVRGWESGDSTSREYSGAVRKLPRMKGAVVEAWSPEGNLVRIDTLATGGEVVKYRLWVAHDSLFLSADSLIDQYSLPHPRAVSVLEGGGSDWKSVEKPPYFVFGGVAPDWARTQMNEMMGPLRLNAPSRYDWAGLGVTRFNYRLFAWEKGERFPWLFWNWGLNTGTNWRYRGGRDIPIVLTWNDCALLPGENQSLSMLCPER